MFRALGALTAVLLACLPTPVQAAGTAEISISVAGPSTADQGTRSGSRSPQ
jgi:hypothetical protein